MKCLQSEKSICLDCRHCGTCHLTSEAKRIPIVNCQHYEPGAVVIPKIELLDSLTPSRKESVKRPLGLCVNCSLRKNCALSTTPGGVWYCEEYK
jgi:hypothetical protein